MVHFLHPQLFWILVVPFLIFAFLVSTNKHTLDKLFSKEMLDKLEARGDYLPLKLRNILLFASLFLMMVAMARPVIDGKEQTLTKSGLHIVMAIDISSSMRSQDNYPNRLEFAKQKAKEMLEHMSSDEVSLVAFASNAFMISPYTNDSFALSQMVDGISGNMITRGATDFESLADIILAISDKQKQKIAIIFSDGGDDKEELDKFSSMMRDAGVKLYVVLVGTKEGSPVLNEDGQPYMLKDGTTAITKQNELLGDIALETHGAYIKATYNNKDVLELLKKIEASNKTTHETSKKLRAYTELFYIPLALSILLLLLSLISMPDIKSRSKK